MATPRQQLGPSGSRRVIATTPAAMRRRVNRFKLGKLPKVIKLSH